MPLLMFSKFGTPHEVFIEQLHLRHNVVALQG